MFNRQAFRAPPAVKTLVDKIVPLARRVAEARQRPVQVMEVCGGHTHAIFHSGIDQLIGPDVEWVHGPGCPVCVLPAQAVDEAIALAQQPGAILATFGDVLRVPGRHGTLAQASAQGANVQVVYSPMDALTLAQQQPDKRVVFFAIGFDTTMPGIAFTIQAARQQGLTNIQFLCYHIRLIPTLIRLLEQDSVCIDGFIGPGHVSIVLGADAYQPIARRFGRPLVISGFEPVDLLNALLMLLQQLDEGRCEIENAYARVVNNAGNLAAKAAMAAVFDSTVCHWRGVGEVPESVNGLTPDYRAFDARSSLPRLHQGTDQEPAYCAEVLTGNRKPHQCPHFGHACQPETPMGPLMVSSEGACAAYHKYNVGKCKEPCHEG